MTTCLGPFGRKCAYCGSGEHEQCLLPTMFLCGPSKCEHDYSRYEPMEGGGTAVCSKCGALAFDEAAWL